VNVAYFLHVIRVRNTAMNERDRENPITQMIPGLFGASLIRRLCHNDAAAAS
jgi:hypothetical protein